MFSKLSAADLMYIGNVKYLLSRVLKIWLERQKMIYTDQCFAAVTNLSLFIHHLPNTKVLVMLVFEKNEISLKLKQCSQKLATARTSE